MAVRSPKYPLDVSTRYSESVITGLPVVRARDRISGLVVHPDTDDLTNEVIYKLLKTVWVNGHKTLAYCDVIDLAQEANAATTTAMDQRLTALTREVEALRTSIDTLTGFFGVSVPAWLNREEVENGDDMGIARQSAAALGLVVTFQFDRLRPGFGHEDVLSIEPPAGTFLARGSGVTVTLNLEG